MKNLQRNWGTNEEKAFQILNQYLVSSPISKNADENKPFIIRIHASSYDVGAILLKIEVSE